MADYLLYYSPSACSLAVHIVLAEAGASYELDRVNTKTKTVASGKDWLAINPKGYVPALQLPSGDIITEAAVILRYLADTLPGVHLAPVNGTLARVRLDELIHFISTEIHKGMAPLYKPVAGDEFKKYLLEVQLPARLTTLSEAVKPYLGGETFSIADAYAFYALRAWQHHHKQTLTTWPALVDYYQRLAHRPSVEKALAEEGITA